MSAGEKDINELSTGSFSHERANTPKSGRPPPTTSATSRQHLEDPGKKIHGEPSGAQKLGCLATESDRPAGATPRRRGSRWLGSQVSKRRRQGQARSKTHPR